MLTQLLLEPKGLSQVSRAAAQTYQEEIQVLEEWVFASQPLTNRIISGSTDKGLAV